MSATPKDISKVAAKLTKLLETAAKLQEQQDAATAAGVPPDSPYPPTPRRVGRIRPPVCRRIRPNRRGGGG